jgi:hypothetical protein
VVEEIEGVCESVRWVVSEVRGWLVMIESALASRVQGPWHQSRAAASRQLLSDPITGPGAMCWRRRGVGNSTMAYLWSWTNHEEGLG